MKKNTEIASEYIPPKPVVDGIIQFDDVPLESVIPFIDWTPFFLSWEMRGKYPDILNDRVYGHEAKKLLADAQNLLKTITEERIIRPRALCRILPANTAGMDDIEVYADESRTSVVTVLNMLRQQSKKVAGQPNMCLADFTAPKESGIADYIGAFVVTSGHGVDEAAKEYERQHDDYSAIMLKAIADRLAEATAEWLHKKVRTDIWGYTADELLANEDLIRERYQGIRPAPGYPACPDHTEKEKLFALLDVEQRINVRLTEHYAMHPAASVSGWYFSHPLAKYFAVGKINADQVKDYAARKNWSIDTAEKWLRPNLAYEPQ